MPLIQSGSKKAVGENIKKELAAGKPLKQAQAIALETQRRNDGGSTTNTNQSAILDMVRKMAGNKMAQNDSAPPLSEAIAIARAMAGEETRADADKWITVHPHSGTGTPALIGEDGEVKAGMGGKFNGKPISEAKGSGKSEVNPSKPVERLENKAAYSPQPSELPSGHEQRTKYFDKLRGKGKTNSDIINQEHETLRKHEESIAQNPDDLNALGQAKGAHLNLQQLYHEEGNNLLSNEHKKKAEEFGEKHAKLKNIPPKIERPAPQETPKPAEQPKPEYKQARHISEGIPEGQSRITDPKYGDPHDTSIVWENENSYGIPDPDYMGTGYYAQHRWAKGENVSKSKYIFLPKSQVTIEGEGANRKIVAMSDWLAKEKGLSTENNAKKEQEREATEASLQESANKRYEGLIEHAKNAGIKGVRSGMRTATILEKMREAGVEPPKSHQEGGREELAAASTETKYRDIPGKGKGVVLNVPFADKDKAKQHGARWSPYLKKWYFPEGAELPEGLKQWRHDSNVIADAETDYTDSEIAIMDSDNALPKTPAPKRLRKI